MVIYLTQEKSLRMKYSNKEDTLNQIIKKIHYIINE